MKYELLFFETSEYKMNNIKYYYAIFSRTIKKTKCVSLYFTHHSFFSFYRGKNHLKIIFIFNKLVRIFRTVHRTVRRTIQIQHSFFFFSYTNPVPHRNRITRDDHLRSIFSSYASLYILVNHA